VVLVVAQSLALNQEKVNIEMELENKSDEQLRRMLNKNSGLSANQVRSVLREMKKRGLQTPPAGLVTGDRPRSDAMEINKGGMIKKAQMMMGGMANGKKHMYSAGGDVTDKLPNKGLKKLAKTEKGRTAVRNMGFDV
tara:strand:+ start:113 stop:523 length:411 start_codon:yes stop_codon:yes gene_type:complete